MRSATICCTIDDFQKEDLTFVMEDVFGTAKIAGTVVIRANPSGRPVPSGFAQAHEYTIFAHRTSAGTISKLPRSEAQLRRYRERDDSGPFMWELFRKRGSASMRTDRQTMFYPIIYNGKTVRLPSMSWDKRTSSWIVEEELQAGEVALYPIDEEKNERRWRWSPERFRLEFFSVQSEI